MNLRLRCATLVALAAAMLLSLPLVSSAAPPRPIPGELLIRYKKTTGPSDRASLRAQMHAQRLHEFKFIDVEHVRLQDMTSDEAIRRFAHDPKVEYIEPDYEWSINLTPNDARFPEMYALHNTGQTGGTPGADIKALQAWDLYTGDPNLKIGVIDTGVDYNHEDLAANIWTNPGEIPGNGIDDDGNGYVDDVHGYDFVNHDGDPFDDNGHGSHTSGTIAAVGNNSVGVAGINWHAKIVAIKFLNAGGSGSTDAAIAGVQYAITVGCRLTSNSWGGGGFSQALLDAINAAGAAGQLFVAAAGNSSVNTDVSPQYPAAYDSPYIISVAATDDDDNLASFSNYGSTTVDLAAPGVDILSVQAGGGYRLLSGTSMATPHVAGVVGLAMGRFPSASNLQIKQLVLNSVDVKPQLAGKCLTSGRLNAFLTIAEPDSIPPGMISDLVTQNPASNSIGLAWTATGDDGGTGRASSYEIRYSTAPITDLPSFLAATLVAGSPDPHPAGSAESFEVTGLSFSTPYYFALRAKDEFGNAGPVSNVATGTTLGIPDITASPTSFTESLLTGATASQTLTLRNDGAGTLDFTVPTPQLQFAQPVIYPYVPLAKGDADTRVGDPVALGHGGPDGFGYRWVDSNEPGGPTFSWVDITGVGDLLTLSGDDANSGEVAMGMDFPFYGTSFNSLRVCTNGWLSFTSAATAYDNQALPNAGAPENLIAPFWDDLDFGGVPRVYTYFDGTRFIVSWIGVPHYSSGGPYSFQAILYTTGEIRLQYQSMGSPLNSATVGIQNGAKNVGLTVAFNTPYVASDLAVRIVPLTQWLTVTPTSGRIYAGMSQDLQVQFNALGLDGGTFDGTVRINSNDPDENPLDLAAQLHVIGAPDIAVNPASLAFGTVFVGAQPTQNLTVSNPGTDVLDVTSIGSDDASVTTDVTAFSIPPHGAQNVAVRFAPTTPGAVSATLTILSNDPDTPSKLVGVTGNAVPAPSFSVSPDSIHVTLPTNTMTSRTLRVSNSGGSNYVFTCETLLLDASGTVVQHGDADNIDVPKGGEDVQSGPAPLTAGGPDVFGYTYQDSDEPTGPAFSWVDVRGVGTQIPMTGDDVNTGTYPIGFDFPFYGTPFNSFRICTNGFVSFTSTKTTLTNTSLPNNGSTAPENLLAVFWDDLNFTTVRRAYYYNDGTKLVIQYQDVPRYGTSEATHPNTFEILLYPNGTIVYQYLSITALTKNSVTIGIQNATRDDGLQVVFNANYVKDNLAIRFRPPARFLTVSPASGTVPPGGYLDLNVGFDATALFGGLYRGAVRITGNDPVLPQQDVPANLTVVGVPDIAAIPASLDFGTGFLGFPTLRQISIANVGTDNLVVSNITFNDASFGVDQNSFTVPPLGNALLFVSFNPATVGPHDATMTVLSNDPDTPSMAVPITANGLVAPDIRPDPDSVTATVNIPGTADRMLTLHNDGGSDLNFVVGTTITATSVPVYDEVALGKEESDPRPGILGSGGPDVFGYTWRDSDEPGGPVFDWVDITGIGTPVTLPSGDDGNAQGIQLGFNFPFYGQTFNTVNVCTNGWLSFTSTLTALSNQPLPNSGSGVPENLLAVFWDDLLPGTSPARIFKYSDGTRFILSFVGVPRYSSGGPYTFEVILYPSGRIVYQYLDMQGTRLNEATIGIQNATRDDGLTVAFNENYVHDNLAVELATVPEYLTVDPTSGTIPASGSMDLTVHFNTAGLFGGKYDGTVRISSNDPDESIVNVRTHLTAVGVPDIAAAPASLDFGPVYLSLHQDLSLLVRNLGSDDLVISGTSFTNPDYSLLGGETFPITLGNHASHTFDLRFTPSAACNPCAGELRIASNDPDTPTLAVPLTGIGVIPPEIDITPASLHAALATTLGPTAIQTSKPLVIANTGGSDLNWSAEALSLLPAAVYTASGETGKDQAGTPGVLGAGGPDAFGYRWADSDDPIQGVPFDWVDITGVGTQLPVNGDDQNVGPFPLPFPFSFYGNTFTSFRVCSNGWISFTSTATAFGNVALPNASTSTPENLVAPFWDDLDLRTAGKVYSYYDGTKFIISFVAVPHYSSGGPYTFQVLLYPSGTIDYQYLDMQSTRLNEATIGIQNATKDVGLTVVYNAAYVKNDLRVRITNHPGWLTLARTSGTVPAGERDTVQVGFNATGLADGDYSGVVRVMSNDLDEPLTDVPCDLHVGVAAAQFDLDPNSLNRSSSGSWVEGKVTPPAGFTPSQIVVPSVLVERAVPVAAGAPIGDNGTQALYKFNRFSLQEVLAVGDSVPVEVIGRVADATWFQATDHIRVLRPKLTAVSSIGVSPLGMPDQVQAQSVVRLAFEDPPGYTASSFDLWYSPDEGVSWSLVAGGVTGYDYSWSVPSEVTDAGRLELVANDELGVMGSWITNVFDVLPLGITGVEDGVAPDRLAFSLAGRNPGREASLRLGLPAAGEIQMRVYDVRGALVREVARGWYEAGWHRVAWNGMDASGHTAQPGIYFAQVRWNGRTAGLRFALVR